LEDVQKYIVTSDGGKEKMLTFDREKIHKNEAKGKGLIVAAGFILVSRKMVICSGESISLDIKSRGKIDEELFLKQIEVAG
jgi:hypothetical protein